MSAQHGRLHLSNAPAGIHELIMLENTIDLGHYYPPSQPDVANRLDSHPICCHVLVRSEPQFLTSSAMQCMHDRSFCIPIFAFCGASVVWKLPGATKSHLQLQHCGRLRRPDHVPHYGIPDSPCVANNDAQLRHALDEVTNPEPHASSTVKVKLLLWKYT